MEVGLIETLIGTGLTILGAFLGKGVDWFRARSANKIDESKADSAIKTTEVEKAAEMYRSMIADLRKDIDEMFALIKNLEEERLQYRIENASLKAENASLKPK